MIDTPGFTYEEFEKRLNKFLDEVTKSRTSYGILEARGNKWLDIFPISITWEDIGGEGNVAGIPVDKVFMSNVLADLLSLTFLKKVFSQIQNVFLAFQKKHSVFINMLVR